MPLDHHAVAELIERDAITDLFAAASNDVRRELGLSSAAIGGMRLFRCHAFPFSPFNRAIIVESDPEVTAQDLEQATDWLDRHARSWVVQVAPAGLDAQLRDDLARANLFPDGHPLAKFVRTGPAAPPDLDGGPVAVEAVDATMAAVFGAIFADKLDAGREAAAS